MFRTEGLRFGRVSVTCSVRVLLIGEISIMQISGQIQSMIPATWRARTKKNGHGNWRIVWFTMAPGSTFQRSKKRWDFQPHENTERAWKVVTWSFYQSEFWLQTSKLVCNSFLKWASRFESCRYSLWCLWRIRKVLPLPAPQNSCWSNQRGKSSPEKASLKSLF